MKLKRRLQIALLSIVFGVIVLGLKIGAYLLTGSIALYSDALEIFQAIEDNDIPMAIASRTEEPEWARHLLDLLGIRKKFKYEEIFPDSKVTHFNNLHEKSGIPFKKMIFFDDESRNIKEVGNLGVRCHLLNEGINLKEFGLLFHS